MIERFRDTIMIEELLKYDRELFLLLNGLGNETWDGLWLLITNKWSSLPLYAILLYLVHKQFGNRATLIIIIAAVLMITATDQLANLFKYGIQRPRPCKLESLQSEIRFIAAHCGRYGYFSAHSASSMAAAVYISLLLKSKYRLLPFMLLFWAVFIGYSRIYVGVHYPLDVVSGMFFGALLGGLFYWLQHWSQRKFNSF